MRSIHKRWDHTTGLTYEDLPVGTMVQLHIGVDQWQQGVITETPKGKTNRPGYVWAQGTSDAQSMRYRRRNVYPI